ncbi:MAG: GNAT family N-acetyltransferase [Rhodanobacteraceae bacterium]
MIPEHFRVEPASWESDRDAIRGVREQVFIIEQGVPQSEEWDTKDERARHVIAMDTDGRAIGTGRLTSDGNIGRMAVLQGWRDKGVGAAILRVLLEQASTLGYRSVEAHAQTHALTFYEKFGFEARGDEYLECDIPHQTVRLELTGQAKRGVATPVPTPRARRIETDDRAEALSAMLDILGDASHQIAIFTRDLDPDLLDVADTLDQLKRIALSGRGARIRIVVQEPRLPVAKGHRLLAMAQRLPTVVQLRTPLEPQDIGTTSAFVLNDRGGYWYRPFADRFEGEGSTFALARHRELLLRFDETWERSETSIELRALDL